MTLYWGWILISFVPHSSTLSLSRTTEGLFWADTAPFKGWFCLCVASGTTMTQWLHTSDVGQDSLKIKWHKTWLCDCRQQAFSHWSLIAKSQHIRIELVIRPGYFQRITLNIANFFFSFLLRLEIPEIDSNVSPSSSGTRHCHTAHFTCWQYLFN